MLGTILLASVTACTALLVGPLVSGHRSSSLIVQLVSRTVRSPDPAAFELSYTIKVLDERVDTQHTCLHPPVRWYQYPITSAMPTPQSQVAPGLRVTMQSTPSARSVASGFDSPINGADLHDAGITTSPRI